MKSYLLLMVVMILFVSGCMAIELTETIEDDGSSSVVLVYDFSALKTAMQQYMNNSFFNPPNESSTMMPEEEGTGYNFFEQINTTNESSMLNESWFLPDQALLLDEPLFTLPSCEELLANITLENPSCNIADETKIIISGKRTEPIVAIKKSLFSTTYELELVKVISFDKSVSEKGVAGLNMLKMSGITYIYKLTMPGKIISADTGRINENKITIDVTSVTSGMMVTSKKTNYGAIVLVALLTVGIIGIGLYVIFKPKKAPNLPAPPLPQVPPELAAYVKEQLASGYSSDDIKTALLNAGYEPAVAQAAISNALQQNTAKKE